jgi:hypothetical protein
MPSFISHLLKRSPRAGDGQEPAMTQQASIPVAGAPAPAAPDVAHLLGALTEAMAGLAQSQRALLDALKPAAPTPEQAPTAPSPAPAGPPAGPPEEFTVGGDFPGYGGAPPGAVVDFSRLSPLQQITHGLRDARPKGADAAFRAGAD